jgi:peroxiredoxin family protein
VTFDRQPLLKPDLPKLAVFLHSGDYDRMHSALSIAAAAAAMGRKVDLFFFWWALERLASDQLDEPDFGPTREEIASRFEARGAPTLRALLGHARQSGLCTVYGCTGSMGILGLEARAGMEQRVDRFVGWSAILQLTQGVTDRFYV